MPCFLGGVVELHMLVTLHFLGGFIKQGNVRVSRVAEPDLEEAFLVDGPNVPVWVAVARDGVANPVLVAGPAVVHFDLEGNRAPLLFARGSISIAIPSRAFLDIAANAHVPAVMFLHVIHKRGRGILMMWVCVVAHFVSGSVSVGGGGESDGGGASIFFADAWLAVAIWR